MQVTDYNCEYLGISRLCLMENAGKSLSDEVANLSTFKFSKIVKIIIFTGSGGNGGDGFVAARHLLNRGFEVELYLLKDKNEIKSEDALINLEILYNLNPRVSRLKINYLKDSTDVEVLKSKFINSSEDFLIIDGILGTGIKGKIRTKERKLIELINEMNGLKVAIDVPSGLNPLTGFVEDICVEADYTVCFHKVKTGIKKASEDIVGGLITCDIGIPMEAELFVGDGDLLKLNNRVSKSHKGDNGNLLVIGGCEDYSGAPAIAGISAFSSGVDLVHIATPESASIPIKSYSPDLIVHSFEGDYFDLSHEEDLLDLIDKVDVVLLGPGIGQMEETGKLLNKLIFNIKKPCVLDADALKLVNRNLISKREDIIITPHIQEFKQFYEDILDVKALNYFKNIDNSDFNLVNDKIDFLQSIVPYFNGVTVIKGEVDFILQNSKVKLNRTGNSGMTVGGTGDSLAGFIAGLLCQGLEPFDAASIGTYLHGCAGDMAMEEYGFGFKASDLAKFINIIMG